MIIYQEGGLIMRDGFIKKGFVIGIIVLFIGVGVYPSIAVNLNTPNNENTSNELIEFPIQIFGYKGVKSYKISVTKQQYNEFQVLKERFKEDFENAYTMKESVDVYRNMVLSFKELGLLPEDMSIIEAEKLVMGPYYYLDKLGLLSDKITADKLFQPITGDDWELENNNCFISGKSIESMCRTDSPLIPGLIWILTGLWIGEIYYGINIGPPWNTTYPATGWINTRNILKKWKYEGDFYGRISFAPYFGLYIGVKGFTGMLFYYTEYMVDGCYYYGYAKKVKIGSSS
jgi:hypothetical protein